jgi:hypothetical protein
MRRREATSINSHSQGADNHRNFGQVVGLGLCHCPNAHASLERKSSKQSPMRSQNKSLAALLIGFAAAGFAPPPAEDISSTRIAAIVKCTKVAVTQYPDDGHAQHRARYLAYKECMAEVGEAP